MTREEIEQEARIAVAAFAGYGFEVEQIAPIPQDVQDILTAFVRNAISKAVTRAVSSRLVPNNARLWGELFVDVTGEAHFVCHTKDDDFLATKDALKKFVGLLQSQLDGEKQCPLYRSHGRE